MINYSPIKKTLALVWAVFVVACAGYLIGYLPSASLESSIFALLPESHQDPVVREASTELQGELESRFLVLLIHVDPEKAKQAAEDYANVLRNSGIIKAVICTVPETGVGKMLDFYANHRYALLAPEDRESIKRDPKSLVDAAQRTLYLPPGVSGSLGFGKDPFGTWGRWLSSQSGVNTGLLLRDNHLTVEIEGKTAIAVLGTLGPRGHGLGSQNQLSSHFDLAAAAAKQAAGTEILRSGFVFHEMLAARQANHEMTSIGTISALALLCLMLFAFRSLWPTLLGILPVVIGCLVATAFLLWMGGGKVHLIAMVFGSTIVGVAEDYGMLFIAGLYEDKAWDSGQRLREVQRSILLGLFTSVLGYLALFFVPIPGLRQIGYFSIAGLVASWATVVLWYPWLGSRLKPVKARMRNLAETIERKWPKVSDGYRIRLILVGIFGLSLWGFIQMHVDDDVRLLYAHDLTLQTEQNKIMSVLSMPGGGRFFLIRGKGEQEVLEREEKLFDKIRTTDWKGQIVLGVSVFVPSQKRQLSDAALLQSAFDGDTKVGEQLASELGTPEWASNVRKDLQAYSRPMTLSQWLSDPISTPFKYLWRGSLLGSDSVTTLVPIPASLKLSLEQLQGLAKESGPGIVIVDQVGTITQTLSLLRRHLVWVLVTGFLFVLIVLIFLFRRNVWGAVIPAMLGVSAGLGSLGWTGLPINLFSLLALALILGMGVDYGIFVQESRRHRAAALVAINMGAASNILAFGMLVFSTTPALQAFGLVLAVGLGVAWLTAPCFGFRPSEEKRNGP